MRQQSRSCSDSLRSQAITFYLIFDFKIGELMAMYEFSILYIIKKAFRK
jgi:hypothetical protein